MLKAIMNLIERKKPEPSVKLSQIIEEPEKAELESSKTELIKKRQTVAVPYFSADLTQPD